MSDQTVMVYVSCAEAQEIIRFSMNQDTGALTRQDAAALSEIAAQPPPADA
jgi:hypothetical protein